MPPELHLHPDRLRIHASTAAGLSEDLRAAVLADRSTPEIWDGVVADQERLRAAVLHVVGELAQLSATLAGVAAAAEAADGDLARALGRVQELW